jgi:GNAT superfamily N-acetyltransferase
VTVVRLATPADVPELHAMIVELAVYEREPPECVRTTEADLHGALFGPRPLAEAVVAEVDSAVAGHAIFYETFSTWEGGGIWLEDLFVRPAFRSTGTGSALFRHLAALTVERGYARYEWVALDWNTLALDFYARFGAEGLLDWKLHRLSGPALAEAADVAARGGG